MIETSKIIQSFCYLLNKIKKADKLKLVKLLYLADKYHLIRYGRTITNDEFWAMPYGPVGSTAKDILGCDQVFLSSEEYEYTSKMLKKVGRHEYERTPACMAEKLEWLSETDIEALEFIVEHFGDMTKDQLINLTHDYPEWAQYKELFDRKEIKREKIEQKELLYLLENDPLAPSPDHLEESKNLLTGNFN